MAAILKGLQINKGLVGYWPLGNLGTVKGNVAVDLSGRQNRGTLVGSPTLAPGLAGQSLSFNATSQYIVGANVLNLPKVSIACWIYIDTLNDGVHPSYTPIGFSNGYASAFHDVAIDFGYQGDVSFSVYTGATVQASAAAGTLTTGKWFHLCGTYDGSDAVLYVNGVQRATAHGVGSTYAAYTVPNVYIGSGGSATTISPHGSIAGVRVYSRGLSSPEVWLLYTGRNPNFGLIRRAPLHVNSASAAPASYHFLPALGAGGTVMLAGAGRALNMVATNPCPTRRDFALLRGKS